MKPAHLAPVGLVNPRTSTTGRAYPLREADMPAHDGSPESTLAIIRWLGVERGPRWDRTKPGNSTYCNVYAHDLCGLLGAYVPRVWWFAPTTSDAATAVYDKTVGEQSANALYRWLEAYSQHFGWRRTTSLDDAQQAANVGRAVVICARRTIEAASGHISVVAPESARCEAVRAAGKVVLPVQSQAGWKNVELGTIHAWWRGAEFVAWGIWIHDPNRADTEPAPSGSDPPDTIPQTPTSRSSQRLKAVREPLGVFDGRAGIVVPEGEHTPAHLRDKDDKDSK